MSESWLIEEAETDDGFVWNLMHLENGRLRCMAQCYDESFADLVCGAIRWLETLNKGHMSLTLSECPIDANTGKPWVRPKDLPSYDIKFTKNRAPTRKG